MARVTDEQVLRALETVTDFERGADVVSLGMISGLVIEDAHVRFAIEVDADDGAARKPLRAACVSAVRALPGVATVTAVLTAHREAAASSDPSARSGAARSQAGAVASESDGLKQGVIEALRTVHDPEIPVDIYELGLIYRIDIDADNNIDIEMTLTAPGCPVAGSMPGEVEETVRMAVPEAGEVKVNLVWDPPWTMDRMSEAARLELGFF